uniref:Uncharacterized protein n=1 Tax=Branchiostoma floridae TaxID=7739 RepID=C3XUF0_BRAFL|eukprot:XP_002612515.1 hypothetical protein BRAFLDRAFT_75363 [Branchiostoma floridae]
MEAVQTIQQAWDETDLETIRKCISKAGFVDQGAGSPIVAKTGSFTESIQGIWGEGDIGACPESGEGAISVYCHTYHYLKTKQECPGHSTKEVLPTVTIPAARGVN